MGKRWNFPRIDIKYSSCYQTPHTAILFSGGMATFGIFGSHFAGIFLGIDIMVTDGQFLIDVCYSNYD